MADVLHVSDHNFEAEVLKSSIPVLVDFWAPWCGPCRTIAPVVEKLAQDFEGRLKVCKLNTDESPETPGRYNIYGIPTLIVFSNGQEADRVVGLASEPQLTERVKPHLAD